MKNRLLAGISVIALAMAASGSARAFTEIKTAFVPEDPLEQHRIVATSCAQPRSFRRIEMKGGTKFAREGAEQESKTKVELFDNIQRLLLLEFERR